MKHEWLGWMICGLLILAGLVALAVTGR